MDVLNRCALCHCHHDNTTVCDDCACAVAETLRAVLRRAGCDVAVARIDEVRAFRAVPDVAVVPWDRDYVPGEVTT